MVLERTFQNSLRDANLDPMMKHWKSTSPKIKVKMKTRHEEIKPKLNKIQLDELHKLGKEEEHLSHFIQNTTVA